MSRLAKPGILDSLAKVHLFMYELCIARSYRKDFHKAKRGSSVIELAHYEICKPMNVMAQHGAYYFITFIGYYTPFKFVYLFSQVRHMNGFRHFFNIAYNQNDKSLIFCEQIMVLEYLSDSSEE